MNIEEQLMEMVSEKAPLRYQRDEQTLREAARLIAACRAAGFIDEEGKVRKVLGELPLTADGCVIGMGATVFGNGCGKDGSVISSEALLDTDTERNVEDAVLKNGSGFDAGISPKTFFNPRRWRLYSTREAAQATAAKEADNDK